MLREKKDEGGMKDISTEEGENKKREDNDKEKLTIQVLFRSLGERRSTNVL